MKTIFYLIAIIILIGGCAKKDESETDSATATGKIIVYAVNFSL